VPRLLQEAPATVEVLLPEMPEGLHEGDKAGAAFTACQ